MSNIPAYGLKEEEAKRILEELKKYKTGKVVEVKKETKKRYSPPLHSLTSLQREANKLYGFSAKKTLDIAQKLYEVRKAISYPRTESRYLANSNKGLVKEILKKLGREDLIPQVEKVGKRVFDDSKLTDHHAIIPLKKVEDLTEDERKIYNLILRRFLAVFYPPYVYGIITILTEVSGKYLFLTKEKIDISLGWMELYGYQAKEKEIPELKKGDEVRKLNQRLEKRKTQPPPRFTEGTLLKKMESLGLGTPATRAQIIETLKDRKYITKKGKVLIPTEKGKELIEKLKESTIISPQMTAEWERKLEEINIKKLGYKGYKQFLEGIKKFTTEEVEKVKSLTFEVSENFKTQIRKFKRKYKRRKRT
jgi:DNA topoisomerase-3